MSTVTVLGTCSQSIKEQCYVLYTFILGVTYTQNTNENHFHDVIDKIPIVFNIKPFSNVLLSGVSIKLC